MYKINFQIINNILLVSVPTGYLPAKKAEDYCKEVAKLFEHKKELMGVNEVMFFPYHESTGEYIVEVLGNLIVIHLPVGNMPNTKVKEYIEHQRKIIKNENIIILPYRNKDQIS